MIQAENFLYTCCFIGHREIDTTDELKLKLLDIIEKLILEKGVNTFLFGSKSQFNSLCYKTVTFLKEKHPHIKRIYVRAEFENISDDYKNYLLEDYEDTYFPERARGAGKAVYLKRNFHMIDHSFYCVVYFRNDLLPSYRKSGTELAVNYATKGNKTILKL